MRDATRGELTEFRASKQADCGILDESPLLRTMLRCLLRETSGEAASTDGGYTFPSFNNARENLLLEHNFSGPNSSSRVRAVAAAALDIGLVAATWAT